MAAAATGSARRLGGPSILKVPMALRGPGEVAEWSKANDSKSFEGQPSVGSNPTLSVLSTFQNVSCCPNSPVAQRVLLLAKSQFEP